MASDVKNPTPGKCKAEVSDHDPRWPRYYQCSNAAKQDGYCRRHHPSTRKAKQQKADEAYQAQNAYSNYLFEHKRLRLAIGDAVITGEDTASLLAEFRVLEETRPKTVSLPRFMR